MSDRVLILPLALANAPDLAQFQFLSRQIPVMFRNAFESLSPGRFIAAPLAADVKGRRVWVVHTSIWEDSEAREFAAARRFETVVFGSLDVDVGGWHRLHLRALRADDESLILNRTLEGDVLSLARQGLGLLANLAGLDVNDCVGRFRPSTSSAAAYEEYMRGLDHLLVLRSPGMTLDDPALVMEPFRTALLLDPRFDEAFTAGLSCALQLIEPAGQNLPETPVFETLLAWSSVRPKDARIWAVAGEIHIHHKRWNEALEILRRGLDAIQPLNRDLLRRSADVLSEMGRNSDALEFYRQCEDMSHEAAVMERMGTLAVLLNRLDEARANIRRVLADDPHRPDLWMRLALIEQKDGQIDQMWDHLAQLFSTHAGPKTAELSRLATLAAQHTAPETFRGVVRNWYPPSELSASSRITLGKILRLVQAPLESRLCLDSIDRNDLDHEGRSNLARERLNLIYPSFDLTFALLAQPIVNGGMPEDVAFLDAALEAQPDFWPARFLLGLVNSRRGRSEDAVRLFDQVLELQPANDVVWYTRGLQLLKLGRAHEASESIERAVTLNDRESEYHAHWALALARSDDLERAKDALAKAHSLKPDAAEYRLIAAEIAQRSAPPPETAT